MKVAELEQFTRHLLFDEGTKECRHRYTLLEDYNYLMITCAECKKHWIFTLLADTTRPQNA